MCSCWNKLDISEIEKHLDDDVIWKYGTLQKEIHGKAIYPLFMSKLKLMGLNKRTIQSIEEVTNQLLNSINEKCARIRAAFI